MLRIATNNALILDGKPTGLALAQCLGGSVVYTPESRLYGRAYREHKMPHVRYSTAHDASPGFGVAGRTKLEADLRELLARLERE